MNLNEMQSLAYKRAKLGESLPKHSFTESQVIQLTGIDENLIRCFQSWCLVPLVFIFFWDSIWYFPWIKEAYDLIPSSIPAIERFEV